MNYFIAFLKKIHFLPLFFHVCYWQRCLYFICLFQGVLIIYCLTSSAGRKPHSEGPALQQASLSPKLCEQVWDSCAEPAALATPNTLLWRQGSPPPPPCSGKRRRPRGSRQTCLWPAVRGARWKLGEVYRVKLMPPTAHNLNKWWCPMLLRY